MSALGKPWEILVSGAGSLLLREARARWARSGNGRAGQHRCFRSLCTELARGGLGRLSGVERGMSYEDFRRRVPVRSYEGFSPYIQRALMGEPNLLGSGRCNAFAVSSGTTSGRTKHIPVNAGMIAHFRRAGLESLLMAAHRCGPGLFAGRHLFLGGSTTLDPVRRAEGLPPAVVGDLSGIAAENLPLWAERFLYEPGREIAGIGDWPSKIEAIAKRTLRRDIRMLAGIPSWILIFAESMQRHARQAGLPSETLRGLWPGLRCLIHGGVPVGPFKGELLRALGTGVEFHEVYPASEGFIAAQDEAAEMGLRLLTETGLFFEFVPFECYDAANPENMGPQALPLEGVQSGMDYVLLLTTPGGLFRYLIGDLVRFSGTSIPRLTYAGRTSLQLSAFGEHVIEKELTDSLVAAADRLGLQVADFHVAPVFCAADRGVARGRHEWWIALRSPAESVCGAELGRLLDSELCRRNDDYEAKRRGGGLDIPLVRLSPVWLFESWMKGQGRWGGQNKLPRCRSDRRVADELLKLSESADVHELGTVFTSL